MNKKDIRQSVLILICIITTVLSVTLISNAVTTISSDITTGGNVGIGTTTPNWSLQIAGSVPFFALTDTSAGVDEKHWVFQSNRGNLFIGTSTDDLSATSSYMTIGSDGNVGIGTTNLVAALTIGSSSDNRIIFQGNPGIFDSYYDASLRCDKSLYIADGSTDDLTIGRLDGDVETTVRGSFYAGIGKAGNMGIGTTTPWGTLALERNPGDSATPLLNIATTTASNATTSVFLVGASGNVGIGTTSPAGPLDVYTTATTTMIIDSNNAAKGSCLKLKDVDGGGYTYCYVLDGNISCSTNSCE